MGSRGSVVPLDEVLELFLLYLKKKHGGKVITSKFDARDTIKCNDHYIIKSECDWWLSIEKIRKRIRKL